MAKLKNDSDKTAKNMGLGVLVLAILLIGLFTFLYFRSKNSNSASQTNNTNVSQTQSSTQSDLANGWADAQKVSLAKALTAKGAIFYGAYWCSHCKDQKAAFGDSMQYVTYYECDPQGDNPKVDQCNAAGITGYPTWIYKGEKKEGAQSLDDLAAWIGYKK